MSDVIQKMIVAELRKLSEERLARQVAFLEWAFWSAPCPAGLGIDFWVKPVTADEPVIVEAG